MPPKARAAPKPAEFKITELRTGKKSWHAGTSGPPVAITIDDAWLALCGVMLGASARGTPPGPVSTPRKEVIILGKALFGRGRLAFEVQEVDYSPAAVRELLKKKKELENDRFGCYDGLGGFGGEDSGDEPRQGHRGGSITFNEKLEAPELAPRYSIQVKFEDIQRIETHGDMVVLTCSTAPQCYAKPAGEGRTCNMKVVKDITGGAKTITFTHCAAASVGSVVRREAESKSMSFLEVRRVLTQHSPRLEALFSGVPPLMVAAVEVATPKRKRGDQGEGSSAAKQPRRGSGCFLEEISAAEGSWLRRAVKRFEHKGILNAAISEPQWKAYVKERVLLELREVATLKGDDCDEEQLRSIFAGVTWPEELGPQPVLTRMPFVSYKDGMEEREMAADILAQVRASVRATVTSSSLKLDPAVVSRGVFLTGYHIKDADEGEPRTVNASARLYAPNGTGNFLNLEYENHFRARHSFTERHSYLHASRGGPGIEPPPQSTRRFGKGQGLEKVFELDFDQGRRKNPTRTSFASHATLARLGAHLFGSVGAMSNRKVFGLVVRAVGLGKFGENNGWPIAVARRRFKCGEEETQTDIEAISGDTCEDASVDGFSVM